MLKSGRNTTLDMEGLTSIISNKYYSLLYQYLPCADTVKKFKDIRIFKFSYDKEKNIKFINHTDEAKYEAKYKTYHDRNMIDILINESIITVSLEINLNNTYSICGEGVRLIIMKEEGQRSGHASVLYLNYNELTFSFIDPNGDDFSCKTQNQLVVNVLSYILNNSYDYKFKSSEKSYEHVCLNLEGCQLKSELISGSCLLWSLLFMDLILRFGIQQTIAYINTKICHTPRSSDLFMYKYGKYILECITDDYTKIFIYDPYYVKSVTLLKNLKELINQKFKLSKLSKFNSIRFGGITINLDQREKSINFRYDDFQTISFEIDMKMREIYEYYHEFSTYFKKLMVLGINLKV
jgi:hypothetical protein